METHPVNRANRPSQLRRHPLQSYCWSLVPRGDYTGSKGDKCTIVRINITCQRCMTTMRIDSRWFTHHNKDIAVQMLIGKYKDMTTTMTVVITVQKMSFQRDRLPEIKFKLRNNFGDNAFVSCCSSMYYY